MISKQFTQTYHQQTSPPFGTLLGSVISLALSHQMKFNNLVLIIAVHSFVNQLIRVIISCHGAIAYFGFYFPVKQIDH